METITMLEVFIPDGYSDIFPVNLQILGISKAVFSQWQLFS